MPISHSKYLLFRQKVYNHNKYYCLTGASVKPEPTESPVPGKCYCYCSLCLCVCFQKHFLNFIKNVLHLRSRIVILAIILQNTGLLRMGGLYMKTNSTISAQRMLLWKRVVSSAKRTLETFLSLRVKVKGSSSGDM